MNLNELVSKGYAWTARTSIVSIDGKYQTTYWGAACPLKWVHPSLSMDYIAERRIKDVVLAQTDTLEKLALQLFTKAQTRWPEPDSAPMRI